MANSIGQNSVVLVMDRNDDSAKLIVSTLNKAGYDVVIRSEPREILELCQVGHPSTQLVIIDPETPGVTLSELLPGIDPECRVLIVADPELLESAPEWAFSKKIRASLTKPVRRARLLGSVLQVASEPLYHTA
jgi:DNA-binding NtrC family response regulator